jgi:hypothetical protein
MAPKLTDMATWTELTGYAQLRSFVDDEGHFWLEQNSSKQSKWGKLARGYSGTFKAERCSAFSFHAFLV